MSLSKSRIAPPQVVVAGHICLDIFPTFARGSAALTPGHLINVGPALRATGGTVANTGLALHRLGVPTRLVGKVGADGFGREILDILEGVGGRALTKHMVIAAGQATSYSIVLSPPGVDRTFLHCPGANDTFGAADLDVTALRGARLLHFGYPPLMRRMFEHEGRELERLLTKARGTGVTVSLDMSRPDPHSESGRVAWTKLLARVLPAVDVFLPSIEESLYMLDRQRFDTLNRRPGGLSISRDVDIALLAELSGRLLDMGVAIVGIKLGDQGLYLRTTPDTSRLARMGRGGPTDIAAWTGRELLAPCFKVQVAGTTGAGDCTIAGFLAALLRGDSPEQAARAATAVGACSVEQADATSGVPAWGKIASRLAAGWATRRPQMARAGCRPLRDGLMAGPHDRGVHM